MPLSGHLDVLSTKHSVLEKQLADALNHPSIGDDELARLKREKLKLKDEIRRLSDQSREH